VPQPDTEILSGPAGTVDTGDATFTFAGNDQPRMSFRCTLDGAPVNCSPPSVTFTNLPDGQHTFTVTAVDQWGTPDESPAARTWTVARPVPADRDRDSVLDAADNCPDAANPGQGDGDSDGIGDACELLPPGDDPIQAGIDAKVRLLSGEVFVKLPPGAANSALTASLRVPFQDSGFLPLKGVATVPMGSTIDTRLGEIALTAAVNGQRATSRRQLRREARYRAGIFAIRQTRFRKGPRKKRIPPRAELTSAPGAERPCRTSGPAKGARVRSLVTTAKGIFRTVGGAATAAPAKGRTATFSTTDRCDGTVTSVGRGRVAVIAKRTGKRTTVRAGRAFIVRARLFAAKGRGS
jgi:Thrombospondin type 3 repeat